MSLKTEAAAALHALGFPAGPSVLAAQHDVQQLTCELDAVDRLACSFTRLAVTTPALAGATVERLKKISESLSQRLTYLLEPISPIEIDAEGCVVQLRSNPPQKQEDAASYYELLVRRGGELSLHRYTKASGSPRQAIAAEVTREVLLRLVDDFSAAAT